VRRLSQNLIWQRQQVLIQEIVEHGDRLREVSRSSEDLPLDLTTGKRFARRDWGEDNRPLRLRAQTNSRIEAFPAFNMTGQAISVKTGQKDGVDVPTALPGTAYRNWFIG
jgi:hypothetical protein